jgi:hypothetical protein
MERLPSLKKYARRALGVMLLTAGCVHSDKSTMKPAEPAANVKPASTSTSLSSITSMVMPGAPAPNATEIACMWQNRISHLPDPTKNGTMSPGLTGKMFLFGAGANNVPANGKLTVDLLDESQGKTGSAAKLLERWVFDKDTLKKLASVDEMFGKCYMLFLPWPTYKPEINQVRLMVKYEPVQGETLFVAAESLTIDATNGGAWQSATGTTPPPALPMTPSNGMPSTPRTLPMPRANPAPPVNTPLTTMPFPPQGAGNGLVGPGGLPPIVSIAGQR